MLIRTDADLQQLRAVGAIVARTIRRMRRAAEPGMTTLELDAVGRALLEREGCRPAPELTYGFPGATCISVNHAVAHGVPGRRRIRAGDLVNIDVSAERDGYFADAGASFVVPPAAPERLAICRATKAALANAIAEVRPGRPLRRIGQTIERTARRGGYTVIRNLGSHGVGRALHEAPDFIPGYDEPRLRQTLQAGQVITIEPFLSTGAEYVDDGPDGWTQVTHRRYLTAQYEHTMVVTSKGALIVTAGAH